MDFFFAAPLAALVGARFDDALRARGFDFDVTLFVFFFEALEAVFLATATFPVRSGRRRPIRLQAFAAGLDRCEGTIAL